MQLAKYPRFPLAYAPTPLERLAHITATVGGPDIFIKRDDCTGLALGGNKTRKLEYLIGAALAEGATDIITEGGLQSNHVRQSAAAAVKARLTCHLVLNRNVAIETAAYQRSGNLLLDHLLGATLHVCAPGEARADRIARLTEDLRRGGRRPYLVPTGGSNAVGALGYARLAGEIVQQATERDLALDYVVVASGSGGTQAGLVAGMAAVNAGIRVIGVDIDDEPEHVTEAVTTIAAECAGLLGCAQALSADAFELACGYAKPGYGLPNEGMKAAVTTLARTEGILLDPVYTGKAFAGLLGLVTQGRFAKRDKVVFVHTGGAPALFAYGDEFLPETFP